MDEIHFTIPKAGADRVAWIGPATGSISATPVGSATVTTQLNLHLANLKAQSLHNAGIMAKQVHAFARYVRLAYQAGGFDLTTFSTLIST